jgi:hypothetical protein
MIQRATVLLVATTLGFVAGMIFAAQSYEPPKYRIPPTTIAPLSSPLIPCDQEQLWRQTCSGRERTSRVMPRYMKQVSTK